MSWELARHRYGKDNYTYLLLERGEAALVDPGDAAVARALADEHGVRPGWILHTHGHADHTGGTAELRAAWGATVLGHPGDAHRFAPDGPLLEGRQALGAISVTVHEAPGHTPGSLLIEWRGNLLTGDTLFWAGCGNCKGGGDPRQLARSFLGPVARLDGGLLVQPGHDYAELNLPFALALEPGLAAATARLAEVQAARAAGQEPPASSLAQERSYNPFLRVADVEAFVALRAQRDGWTPHAGPSRGR
jgi:hydroxyacylglutathione hydrolase